LQPHEPLLGLGVVVGLGGVVVGLGGIVVVSEGVGRSQDRDGPGEHGEQQNLSQCDLREQDTQLSNVAYKPSTSITQSAPSGRISITGARMVTGFGTANRSIR